MGVPDGSGRMLAALIKLSRQLKQLMEKPTLVLLEEEYTVDQMQIIEDAEFVVKKLNGRIP